MKKSEIINRVIMNAGLAGSKEDANRIFIQNFIDHFLEWNLQKWDTDVPAGIAKTFINSAGSGGNTSVRYLIKDLDAFLTSRMMSTE